MPIEYGIYAVRELLRDNLLHYSGNQHVTRQQPSQQLCAHSAASGVWASGAEATAEATAVGMGEAFSGGPQRGQGDWMAAGAEREGGETVEAAGAEREGGETVAAAGGKVATGSRAPSCLCR